MVWAWVCLEPKKCLRENLEIANDRTFPEVHRCSLQILEECQELNFVWGASYQQAHDAQESTLNMWFDVNKVLKVPLSFWPLIKARFSHSQTLPNCFESFQGSECRDWWCTDALNLSAATGLSGACWSFAHENYGVSHGPEITAFANFSFLKYKCYICPFLLQVFDLTEYI